MTGTIDGAGRLVQSQDVTCFGCGQGQRQDGDGAGDCGAQKAEKPIGYLGKAVDFPACSWSRKGVEPKHGGKLEVTYAVSDG